MAMLSSSSTSPRSSRPTIASSSLSARSKLMSFRSGYFSAAFAMPLFRVSGPHPSRRVHEQLDVDGDRFRQSRQIVTAFEHRNHPPLGGSFGHLAQLVRDPSIVVLMETKAGERVRFMRVKTGGNQNEVR